MKEYKYVSGPAIEVQKWLNQWRHEFNIEIIEVQFVPENKLHETWIYMLMARTKRVVLIPRDKEKVA